MFKFNNSNKVVLTALIMVMSSFIEVYSQFNLSAEFRPRGEFRHGYANFIEDDEKPVYLVTQRTRLNLGYNWKDKVKTYIAFQDVRIWGQADQLSNNPSISLYQAYVTLNLDKKLAVTAGRQRLVYDDGRIISDPGWNQIGRVHDGVKLHFEDSTFQADAVVALNQDDNTLTRDLFEGNSYKNLFLTWLKKDFQKFNASLIWANLGFQRPDSSVVYLHTIGSNVNVKLSKVNINASYYRQSGKDTNNRNVKAFLFSTYATIPIYKRIKSVLGYDHVSGTNASAINNPNGENNSFNPLFGYRHKFYGVSDYFYIRGFDPPAGLKDVYLKNNYKFNDKLNLNVDFHSFFSDSEITDTNVGQEEMDNYLGFEYSCVLNYKHSDISDLQLGYVQLFGTSSLEAVKGKTGSGNFNTFVYLSLTVKPQFIK